MNMRKRTAAVLCLLLFLTLFHTGSLAQAASGDLTTKFRVYQKNRALLEFTDYNKALSYAKAFTYSRVERIGSREWLWNNYPKFKVYQLGQSNGALEFNTKSQALAAAQKLTYASVRDFSTTGWAWNNYPVYRLYQGDKTLDSWVFPDLASAQKTAKSYGNMHIIDLRYNQWVWDNLTAAQTTAQRAGTLKYEIRLRDETRDEWHFAYLEDAVKAAVAVPNSIILNTESGKTIYSNDYRFQVYQNDKLVKAFANITQAIQYSGYFSGSRIVAEGTEIWTSIPYYGVKQNGKLIKSFGAIPSALAFAKGYSNATVETAEGVKLWDNFHTLLYGGWTGTASASKIHSQVAGTMGLDLVFPAFFSLKDASGALEDHSSADLVSSLKASGYRVQPLVDNQFDSALTSKFLQNKAAQTAFIRQVVDRTAALGADGLNLDFESLSGSNRDAFSAFVAQLSAYAHQRKLTVSIDLPRGDTAWNAKTAFDAARIAQAVDYIMIMAYDEHWAQSPEPGSVAGLEWAEQGVKDFLAYGVERSKLFLGVPFYVREWTLDASGAIAKSASGKSLTRAIYMKDIPALLDGRNAVKTWDAAAGQYRVTYTDDSGAKRVFWLEDSSTMLKRLAIAKKYELAGVAAWRLDYEPATLWQTLLPLK